MFRLAAFDMDGTLLLPDHYIGQYSLEILQQLAAKPMILTFATGRHYLEMRHILATTGLQGYLITGNGTRIHDHDGQKLYGIDLLPDVAEEVINTAWRTEASMHVFRDDGWFTAVDEPALLASHQFSGFRYHLVDVKTLSLLGNSKICFVDSHEKLLLLQQQLDEHFRDRVDLCFSASHCLEVMPVGCNKGHALQRLTAHLGLTMADCIAFGDAMNDKEMLESVGRGLVMGNALPLLKQHLPTLQVIGPCANQAVAHYLQHWLHNPHLEYSPE